MKRWLRLSSLLGSLLAVLSACNVASVREAPSTIAHNECQTDDDCGPGGICDGLQCRSRSATFSTVLFEVTPPADGSDIAGVQFLTELHGLSPVGGDASLDLGTIAQVAGRVIELQKCTPIFIGPNGANGLPTTPAIDIDGSVPARVSLIPTSGTLGLYSPRAVVQAVLRGGSYYGFSVNVDPGTYDIYVEPSRQPDELCIVPPQLLRGKTIESGTLDIFLPEPSVFDFHVAWPLADGRLNGWMVDMLDSVSGRAISNRVPLTLEAGGKSYVASLLYSLVDEGKAQQKEQLIRLSPPDGLPEEQAAPTVLLARSALGLVAAGSGTLSLLSSLPTAVRVHGQVTSGDSPMPVAATVTLVATKITGIDRGVPASFTRTVTAGVDGQFDVHLLPGVYRVSTVPKSSLEASSNKEPLAADDDREWIIPSAPLEQAGKVIDLGPALPVYGQALDASGGAVATAQVQAVASPLSVQSTLLQALLGEAPAVPRASAGGVSSTGDFSFKTDPGVFDITVRPSADTGFAWLVMPNVPVTSAGSGVGLGPISMPLPVPYRGTVTVTDAEGPKLVPGALVRAYVYLKDGDQYTTERSSADSVLQVAEARADKNGVFDILIPAELNRPVN